MRRDHGRVPAMNNETALVVGFIQHGDLDRSETDLLQAALACTAVVKPEEGPAVIDANEITFAFMERRSKQLGRSIAEDEVHDYVRHMLREAKYVCRHAIDRGHLYRLHEEPECSSTCAQSNGRSAVYKPNGSMCPDCHVWVPAAVECDLCH